MIDQTLEYLATHPDAASATGVFTLCAVAIGLALLAYFFRDIW